MGAVFFAPALPASPLVSIFLPDFFVMAEEYEALISAYRVVPKPSKWGVFEAFPYLAGGFLLVVPFFRVLSIPWAVFTLSYFAIVFVSLTIGDFSPSMLSRAKAHVVLLKSVLRYSLAGRSARALWETVFFSSGDA